MIALCGRWTAPDRAPAVEPVVDDVADLLTRRELDILTLAAGGRANDSIAAELVLSNAAVAKHVSNIFTKLRLDPSEDNRRVKAILQYLSAATYGG